MSSNLQRFASDLPFPFAKAVRAGDFLFLSGQVSMSPGGKPLYGSVTDQSENIMQSIAKTLKECGSDMDSIVKVTVWLSDMKHFAEFNQVYATYFKHGYPARSAISCELVMGLDVEVEVQAMIKK
ncbi:MAG: RidA family protein [Hafnia paralvei]|jgi:2-iminobutanoate/2-iminopropanoate deaminase|uniref:RidA family protein n=1 Tax=Hafnia paralvei TaxID=546367 RepID=UPI001584EB7E|nr:RidA family protein [Hafnia paralvei]MCE9879829.1 RidA family protein [Hafnia paralvei]MCE9909909.1 RidA family protein [Hafnia paralvei]MCE9911342.1 RidA family protein [Hafnia paralvei]NUN40460.1 RidA family protein [Hafnia paralvei]